MERELELSDILPAAVAAGRSIEMQVVQLKTEKWHLYIKIDNGAQTYLSKPFDSEADATKRGEELERLISAVVGERPATSYGGGN